MPVSSGSLVPSGLTSTGSEAAEGHKDKPRAEEVVEFGGQPLRIAIFTFSYAPFMTGIATGVHLRVRALLDLGHEILLIHPEANGDFPDHVRDRAMRGLNELQANGRFQSVTYPTWPHPFCASHPEPKHFRHWDDTSILKSFKPDAVLVDEAAGMRGFSSVLMGGYGRPVGVDYSKAVDVPVVNLFEGDWVAYADYYLGRWLARAARPVLSLLVRRFSSQYDIAFFPSREMKKKYESQWIPSCRYVPFHGIDGAQFYPEETECDSTGDDDRPLLLFVGRIAREKRIDDLWSVFERVRQRVPSVRLVIVGSGPDATRLRKLATRLGSNVIFAGECFGEDLRKWYTQARVFLNPSCSENFCTTNLEALACGTPVVAAAAGGNVEQVQNGVNGYLVEPRNSHDMADAVLTILQSPTLRTRMSAAARQTAIQFDALACGRHLDQAVRQLIAEKASERSSRDALTS